MATLDIQIWTNDTDDNFHDEYDEWFGYYQEGGNLDALATEAFTDFLEKITSGEIIIGVDQHIQVVIQEGDAG